MTLQPIPAEFPYIWENLILFISVQSFSSVLLLTIRSYNVSYLLHFYRQEILIVSGKKASWDLAYKRKLLGSEKKNEKTAKLLLTAYPYRVTYYLFFVSIQSYIHQNYQLTGMQANDVICCVKCSSAPCYQCSYIMVHFVTASSQNLVCILQEMCHLMIFVLKLLYDKR